MCGRHALRTPWQRLAEHFDLRVSPASLFPPSNSTKPDGFCRIIRSMQAASLPP
jgi:hypothetical protein